MTRQYSPRESSTRRMANKRRHTGLIIGITGLGILVILYLIGTNPQAIGLGGGAFLVVLLLMRVVADIVVKGMDRQIKGQKRALRGARAEDEVEEILARLDENYLVMNDISSPSGNIDHLVIGRTGGMCLIETKSHWGDVEISPSGILIDGRPPEKDFIAQTLRNAYWVRDEVSSVVGHKPWINAFLVFTNAFVPFHPPVRGVQIMNKRYLWKELVRLRRGDAATWRSREEIADLFASHNALDDLLPRGAA